MADRVFATRPSLGARYARAVLTGPLHRGAALPDSSATLRDQRIDPAHLGAYQRLCGFRVSHLLPPTYLHLLAFPLAVDLMVAPAFPFPLIGMVHVANSIEVLRPVAADEAVSFRVRTADLRPHAAGHQFDVLVAATVGTEPVWSGRSTYLRRGGTAKPSAAKPASAAAPITSGVRVRVPGDIGRRYAALSGDRNPIHLSALAAKAFGFPRAIAHGMWVQARVLACLEGRLPPALTVQVAFQTPVLLPATMAVAAERAGAGWRLDVRDAAGGRPHLRGSIS